MAGRIQKHEARQIMCRADYEITHKRDHYLKDIELHHHDFYEVYFFVSGDITFTIEGRIYRVMPGDLLIISPNELHQAYIQADVAPYERYVLWLDPRLIKQLSDENADLSRCFSLTGERCSNLFHLSPENRTYVSAMMEHILTETESSEYGSQLLLTSLLTCLMVMINRIAAKDNITQEDVTYSSRVVADVINYVNLHYGEDLSLDGLSERFFVSKYHLSHEFNRHIGTSVYRYIQKKRLQIACQLLGQGQKPNRVSTECGFGDYTGFYRAFKAEYGISPREYADSLHSPDLDDLSAQ